MNRREKGTGTIYDGYVRFNIEGRLVREHTLVAEKAFGGPLPKGSIVHHVDFNKSNNENTNLVVCPSDEYHQLLHARTRALDECGDANKRKCQFCKKWDLPPLVRKNSGSAHEHPECRRIDNARRLAERKAKNVNQL